MFSIVWRFMRDHVWGTVLVLGLLGVFLYKPIAQSGPVVERTHMNGTVVAIMHSGESRLGRQPLYGYRISLAGGGQPIAVRSPSIHRIGEEVVVERVVRRGGNVAYLVVGPAPLR